MNEQELLQAAKEIRRYCLDNNRCPDCLFFNREDRIRYCCLNDPSDWVVEENIKEHKE